MFYRALTRLAAQVLLTLSAFVWGVVALLDVERVAARPAFLLAAAAAVVALVGVARGQRGSSWLGAFALVFPIGVMADFNGASRGLWVLWAAGIWATERWMRDGIAKAPPGS